MFVYNKHLAKLQHVETLHEIAALINNSELNEHIDTIVTGLQVQYQLRCSPDLNFLPLRQKLLKTLQNEAFFPLITKNVLIYASNHFN